MLGGLPAIAKSVCITRDASLRRSLRRSLNAAGSDVEFYTAPAEAELGGVSLLFVDSATWRETGIDSILAQLNTEAKLVVIGESIEDNEVIELLHHDRLDHVIGPDEEGDHAELLSTSIKLLSGDLFGVEKYLAWGVKVHELEVTSYSEKRAGLEAVGAYARQVGARRSLVARIENATDELLMNAIYDAPAAREGGDSTSRLRRATGAPGFDDEPALLRFACDSRYFAVSVQDSYGELRKPIILDHLSRARSEQGRPQLAARGGAGLGLYFILSSATRFIANISPKRRTEVICLFDLDRSGARAPSCARSIHIFTSSELDHAA